VTKTSVQGHELGDGFIYQIRHGGTLGELYGTWREVMECSSARRKELKLTRKMRAAWAGLSGLRQERFQGSWYVPDLFGTLMGNFKTCMRCL